MNEPTNEQRIVISRANEKAAAAKMDLEAQIVRYEAACVEGDRSKIEKRLQECEEALQEYLHETARKYDVARGIIYGD